MIGAAIGGVLGSGLVLTVTRFRASRRPTPADRVFPHVRDLVAVPRESESGTWSAATQGLKRIIADAVSGSRSVESRLARLGEGGSLADFRAQQGSYGIGGLVIAFAVSMLLWSRGTLPVAAALALSALGFVMGLAVCDQLLSRRVHAHEERVSAEFPVIADLLALAVAAGESPVQALERIVAVGRGALTAELARVLAHIHAGSSIVAAFESLGQRTGVMSVARFADSMVAAIERGTPIVEVLHAQACDVREVRRRSLIEKAGRQEIFMLVPVVFLILPLVVIFAFFPGMAGLQFVSGL